MRSLFALFGLAISVFLAGAVAAPAAPVAQERTDLYGDPLPPGAVARMGTVRFRHGAWVACLTYSPDGKILAGGGMESVCLWDSTSGKLLRRLDEINGLVSSVAFSSDGKSLAAFSVANDGMIRTERIGVWETLTGKKLQQVAPAPKGVRAVAFAADGTTLLAACCEDKTVAIRDAETGKLARELKGHTDRVVFAAFSADGESAISAGVDGAFILWDWATGKEIARVALPQLRLSSPLDIHSLAFSPDGRTMALDARGLHLYDTATGEAPLREPAQDSAAALAFSPDGKTLAAAPRSQFPIRLWDVAKGREIRTTPGHAAEIEAVALSADGKVLATVGRDWTVRLWEAATGKELGKIERQVNVWSIALSPDGKTAAWGGPRGDGGLWLWPTTGEEPRRLSGPKANVRCVVFSPDGKTVAVGTDDNAIYLWDWTKDKEILRIDAPQSGARALAFSPDGKALASAGFGASLWDAGTGKEIRRFPGGIQEISSVAISPDGRLLATAANREDFFCLVNAATGKELRRVQRGHGPYLAGSAYPKPGPIVFSPDGRAVISQDGTSAAISLYETVTGERQYELNGHLSGVGPVAFSADGRLLASASYDCTALVWDLSGPGPDGGKEVTPEARDGFWEDLAKQDGVRAYQAIRALAAAAGGEPTTAFLRKRLPPVPLGDVKRMAMLIADLDNDEFAVREDASEELDKLGETAAEAIGKAAKDGPPETRRRAEALLKKLFDGSYSADQLRTRRAVEVLERMHTADARQLLEALSGGAAEARLTREAKEALERLAKRRAAP